MRENIKMRAWDKDGNQLPDFMFPDDVFAEYESESVYVRTWIIPYTEKMVNNQIKNLEQRPWMTPNKVGDVYTYKMLDEGVKFQIIEE